MTISDKGRGRSWSERKGYLREEDFDGHGDVSDVLLILIALLVIAVVGAVVYFAPSTSFT